MPIADDQQRRWARTNAPLYVRADALRWMKPLYQHKFDPDQPRVPSGSSAGGRWTSVDQSKESGSLGSDEMVASILAAAQRLAVAGPGNYQRCLNLCYPLLERFQRPGSDANEYAFRRCMNACLGRNLYSEGDDG